MSLTQSFAPFPLVNGKDVVIHLDKKERMKTEDQESAGQNLKKEVKVPVPFLDQKRKIKNGYCFSIPDQFKANPEKESEYKDHHTGNIITI